MCFYGYFMRILLSIAILKIIVGSLQAADKLASLRSDDRSKNVHYLKFTFSDSKQDIKVLEKLLEEKESTTSDFKPQKQLSIKFWNKWDAEEESEHCSNIFEVLTRWKIFKKNYDSKSFDIYFKKEQKNLFYFFKINNVWNVYKKPMKAFSKEENPPLQKKEEENQEIDSPVS